MQNLKNFPISQKLSLLFAAFVFLFSFGLLFYRTFFGVDFFDEPFYAALALRLFTGQKLFVDELNLVQTFSLLTYPFFKIFFIMAHTLDGVILFLRQSLVFLYLSVALLMALILKRTTDGPRALIAASSISLFFTGNMVTLGYNSLGTLFLTIGLISLFEGVSKNRKGAILFSGLFLGMASLAYITFLAVAGFLFFYLLVFCRKSSFPFLFATGVLVLFIYPISAALTHWSDFQAAVSFRKEYLYDTPSIMRLLTVLRHFISKWILLTLITYGFLFFKTYRRFPGFAYFLIAISPVLAVVLGFLSWGNWAMVPFFFSALATLTFPLVSQNSNIKLLTQWVYVPSFVAGLISTFTSVSGHLNSQVGLVPAFMVSLILVGQAMQLLKPRFKHFSLVPLALPSFLIFLFPLNIWSDASFKELTQKVETGPYKGIYTTPQKKEVVETLYSELKPLLPEQGPLLVYPNFSWVYLISPIPPAKGVTWYQNSGKTNEILASLYAKQINPNSRVVRMKIGHGSPIEKPNRIFDPKDPLNHLIEKTHRPIKDTPWYTLFAPITASPTPQS